MTVWLLIPDMIKSEQGVDSPQVVVLCPVNLLCHTVQTIVA